MIFIVLGLLFIVLKLRHKTRVQYWSWWSVCNPFFIGALVSFLLMMIALVIQSDSRTPGFYPILVTINLFALSAYAFVLKGARIIPFRDLDWYWLLTPIAFCFVAFGLALLDHKVFHVVLN